MPKYLVKIVEDYYVNREYTVEAKNEDDARDKAGDIHANANISPSEIEFIEWNYDSVEELEEDN